MALIDTIVQVTITRQTAVASVASFDNLLIAEEFLKASITPSFDERVRVYASLQEIIDAGFSTSSAVYLAAQALFLQNPNTGQIYVGRKLTGIDGSETWTEALTAIAEESSAWYGFFIGTKTLADLEEAADWSEANKKIFFVSDDDSNIISGTGDIAEYANTNNYDRTVVIYHPDADLTTDDPFIESAWSGYIFTFDPGSANWAHKQLSGVPVYNLTTAQRNTALGKKANLFETVAGLDVTRFGTVGSGEYIDIIRGTDWLEARIQERVYTVIANSVKVPYTDAGVQSIVAEVESALEEAVDVGLLSEYNVTFPKVVDIAANDKVDRLLPDINFTATYAGAINKVEINGTISL